MKAVIFEERGGPEVLRIVEKPIPEPGPGEVLIKTAYAGINFVDIGWRNGVYTLPLPGAPGHEGAGVIVALGDGTAGLHLGMEVLGFQAHGTYAEYFLAREDKVAPVPSNLSLKQAAGIAQIFMTAWNALVNRAKLQPGEAVLIQSAGNGAGIAAVQIAKHLGAHVIGAASNYDKLRAAAQSGADECINYMEQDFEEAVMRLTGGRGVDVVLDGLGGPAFTKGGHCLADSGRLLTLGHSSGDSLLSTSIDDLFRGIVVMGGATGLHDLPRSDFDKVLALFEQCELRPVHTQDYPLTEAGQAQRSIEERRAIGKVVLKVD